MIEEGIGAAVNTVVRVLAVRCLLDPWRWYCEQMVSYSASDIRDGARNWPQGQP